MSLPELTKNQILILALGELEEKFLNQLAKILFANDFHLKIDKKDQLIMNEAQKVTEQIIRIRDIKRELILSLLNNP